MTKKELWEENILFYRDLIDNYKLELEPMLDLISKLHNEGLCQLCYPSNSHEALGLSLFEDYSERCENQIVYIIYEPQTHSFTIHYQSGQGNTVFEDSNVYHFTTSNFERIRNWLTSPAS